MERSERGWVRGAIVVGLAGTMMAVALLSPALAVRLATTSYVKAKIKPVSNRVGSLENRVGGLEGTVGNLNQLAYVQGAPLNVPADSFAQVEALCPPGSFVTGGGGAVQVGAGRQIDSYPSHGVGFPAPTGIAPAGHTAWAFEYVTGPSPEAVRAYAICSRVATRTGYTAGSPGVREASRPAA